MPCTNAANVALDSGVSLHLFILLQNNEYSRHQNLAILKDLHF